MVNMETTISYANEGVLLFGWDCTHYADNGATFPDVNKSNPQLRWIAQRSRL